MRKKAEKKIRAAAAMLGPDNAYRLDKVRVRTGLHPKVFDKTILDMARLGTIALKTEKTEGLSPSEIGNMVRRGETVYTYFCFQDALDQEQMSAEAQIDSCAPVAIASAGPVREARPQFEKGCSKREVEQPAQKLIGMRKKVIQWVGREFVYVSCEGRRAGNAADEMEAVFARITDELWQEGLSLDHTVRTRLWAVDRNSRDLASAVRAKYNVGQARAATSSYIMPGRFSSDARTGLDLVALRPAAPGSAKKIVENNPPRKPINYLIYDALLVLAGKTVVLPSLENQLDEILPRITRILAEAGSSWEKVVTAACYLHRSQDIAVLKAGFLKWVPVPLSRIEIAAVDGYSAAGKLIEIEITAETGRQTQRP